MTLRRISVVMMGMAVMTWAGTASAEAIRPGADIQEKVQEAFILAEPNTVIEFSEGVFEFTMGLSLDVDGVTLKGAGHDKTIFSFRKQNAGSEGLIVTSSGVTLRDFAVEDTIGDAIKVKGADQISFLNVRTEWTGGPKPTNGAYGFYPVESTHVLIDGCVAVGASDAGIYVGQCTNVIVRNSEARFNVAGIEIENCYYADVYNNVATRNTGGHPRVRPAQPAAAGRAPRARVQQPHLRQRHEELRAGRQHRRLRAHGLGLDDHGQPRGARL